MGQRREAHVRKRQQRRITRKQKARSAASKQQNTRAVTQAQAGRARETERVYALRQHTAAREKRKKERTQESAHYLLQSAIHTAKQFASFAATVNLLPFVNPLTKVNKKSKRVSSPLLDSRPIFKTGSNKLSELAGN